MVLSHGYWMRQYGGEESVVGRQLRVSGRDYTIVGVAPESFEGNFRGLRPELFLPIQMINTIQATQAGEDALEKRGNHSLFVRARLAPGVTLEQAQATMDAFTAVG